MISYDVKTVPSSSTIEKVSSPVILTLRAGGKYNHERPELLSVSNAIAFVCLITILRLPQVAFLNLHMFSWYNPGNVNVYQ